MLFENEGMLRILAYFWVLEALMAVVGALSAAQCRVSSY
jgi:hypothetical protein